MRAQTLRCGLFRSNRVSNARTAAPRLTDLEELRTVTVVSLTAFDALLSRTTNRSYGLLKPLLDSQIASPSDLNCPVHCQKVDSVSSLGNFVTRFPSHPFYLRGPTSAPLYTSHFPLNIILCARLTGSFYFQLDDLPHTVNRNFPFS